MESSCIRHTDLPHTSKLFADYLYHFDRVRQFYSHSPHDPESYRAAATAIDFPDSRREALVRALRAQNPDSPNLRRLAEPGTVAVVTGQQVGLFSGPAYTIYKALTAIRLAERLTADGISAVPVFWLATEDHDFAEINHCWAFSERQEPVLLRVGDAETADKPVGNLKIGQNVPVEALQQALERFDNGAEIARAVAQAYEPGRSYGEAFVALLRTLLGGFDLLYLDPLDAHIRALAAPLLESAVEHAPELSAAVIERNQELSREGYHAQVHFEPETSLFFLLQGERRIALKKRNGHYEGRAEKFTPQELGARAEHLSPNALLRPVVQDWILPTVAYVGGPAELAYLAQSQVLYAKLLGRMPVAVPRSGFTILDARAAKLMAHYGLSLPAFFHGEERLKETMASKLIPAALSSSVEHARHIIDGASLGLEQALASFDPTLARAAGVSRRKMLYQVTKIANKAAREALRRDERAAADAAYLYNLVFPHKHLQERFYTILPLLARHGTDLIGALHQNVHLNCPDHIVLAA